MNSISPFHTNPPKAASKLKVNNALIGVCISVFGIMWTFAPERLNFPILLQFVFAVPLLYVSSISYTKIAYWKQIKLWDYFGWFTGTTGTAFVLNVVGILTFFLGHPRMAFMYFVTIWSLLIIYTLINIRYNKNAIGIKIFKLLYFIIVQLIFGMGILYL